jgi:hypothetical protein
VGFSLLHQGASLRHRQHLTQTCDVPLMCSADVALVCSEAPFPLRRKHGAFWQVTECASHFLVVRRLPNSRVLSSWISQVRSQIALIIELIREIETLAQRHIDFGGLTAP